MENNDQLANQLYYKLSSKDFVGAGFKLSPKKASEFVLNIILREDFNEAIQLIDKTMLLNDIELNAKLLCQRAECNHKLNRIDKAEFDFLNAFRTAHESKSNKYLPEIIPSFAHFLIEIKKYDQALRITEIGLSFSNDTSILSINNFQWECNYIKSRILIFQNKLDESFKYLEIAEQYLISYMNQVDLHKNWKSYIGMYEGSNNYSDIYKVLNISRYRDSLTVIRMYIEPSFRQLMADKLKKMEDNPRISEELYGSMLIDSAREYTKEAKSTFDEIKNEFDEFNVNPDINRLGFEKMISAMVSDVLTEFIYIEE